MTTPAELHVEFRREDELMRGDLIELTVQQLDRCIEAGEWPWANESSE